MKKIVYLCLTILYFNLINLFILFEQKVKTFCLKKLSQLYFSYVVRQQSV